MGHHRRVQERGRINRFWFVFRFSLFFNLTLFSPLAVPILDRIGFHFLKLRKLTFLFPPSMLFFHTQRVGRDSTRIIPFLLTGGRFHEESSLFFRHFTQMVLGFNFFINFALGQVLPLQCCVNYYFYLQQPFGFHSRFLFCLFVLFLVHLKLERAKGGQKPCNW